MPEFSPLPIQRPSPPPGHTFFPAFARQRAFGVISCLFSVDPQSMSSANINAEMTTYWPPPYVGGTKRLEPRQRDRSEPAGLQQRALALPYANKRRKPRRL